MAEGEFHEAMNLAALWDVPVLFCCENNLYAMGTSLASSESQLNLTLKAASYELPAWSVDGMDVLAVRRAARRALAMVRGGGGPAFLELRTYRFRAHSMFDPDLYREREEIERWKERDPIEAFADQLVAAGDLTSERLQELWDDARTETQEAVDYAEAGTLEPVDDLTTDVYRQPIGTGS